MTQEHQEAVLIYDRIAANRRTTILLMGLFFIVVAGAATAFGIAMGLPPGISPVIIVFVLGFLAFSYFGSSSVALNVAGAREVGGTEEPELTRLVENLSIGSGLPMPKVYVIEDMSMNAFATGRDPKHASVAVTRTLTRPASPAPGVPLKARRCPVKASQLGKAEPSARVAV
jgi:heat shock protein HtpX